jgi:O-antigen ligase
MNSEHNNLTIGNLIKDPALIMGLLFFMVNISGSYVFYHVTSLKIFLVLSSVTLLFLTAVFNRKWFFKQSPPLLVWGILSVPLLLTFPGFIIEGGSSNYNFNYELVSNIITILWAGFLYQSVKSEFSLHYFLSIVSVCVVFVSIWAVTTKFGLNPFDKSETAMASFGNRNYFAGFLILLYPVFLSLSVPSKFYNIGDTFKGIKIFYFLGTVASLVTLFVIQSRAAIAAAMVSTLVVFLITLFRFIKSKNTQVKILISLIGLIIILLGILFTLYKIDFFGSRWEYAFESSEWLSRLVPWAAAWESIKAAPWFGFGLGSSYNLYFTFVAADARLFLSTYNYNHAHSEYLEYIQESGLLGAIGFLIFWGYLFFQLYKLIRYSKNTFISKIAIGILGGLIAYLIQCVFSLAPRTMMVKFPLFTLFGLIFILMNFEKINKIKNYPKSIFFKITSYYFPLFFMMGLCWYLYIPWMEGQYNFVKIKNSPDSIAKVKQLEILVEKRADLYALDYLASQQINYSQWDELQKTIDKLEKVIPYYGGIGHRKILLAKMKGDFTKAIKEGKYFQARDRYYIPSIHLLIEIAITQKNQELFFEQLSLLTRSLIFNSGLHTINKEESVIINKSQIKNLFSFADKAEKLIITWNIKELKNLINISRINLNNKKWKNTDRYIFINYLEEIIFPTPYLQLKIYPEFQDQKPNIVNHVREYFLLKENKRQDYNRIKVLETQISEQARWEEYLKRNHFKNLIIQHLIQMVFPLALQSES